jgi:aromatic ring-opening dioxygenase catalytic subunit (LigB family)
MAQLVAALMASHAPLMTGDPDSAPTHQRVRVHAAMAALGAEIAAARPSALVICSNEHFTNFFYDNLPPFCIGVAEGYDGPVEPWLRVKRGRVPGQPELGKWLLGQALGQEFDLAFSHELRLDHGIMTVLHFLAPDLDVPIVPIIQNCAVKPLPTPRRCYRLGQELRRAIAAWPQPEERIALIGTGGLSHWVGLPDMGRINEDFDHWLLDRFAAGRANELLDLSDEQIEVGGNGAHEIRSWLTVAGAMGERPAHVLAYEPIQPWATGMGIVSYLLSASPA